MAKRPDTDQSLNLVIQDPEAEAYKLRLAGLSHSEIADAELGFPDARSVGRAIKSRLDKEARMIPGETRESLIELEIARLDHVQSIYWPKMNHDDKAGAMVLNCIKLRIMLQQLDSADISTAGQTVLVVQGDEAKYIAALKSAVDN